MPEHKKGKWPSISSANSVILILFAFSEIFLRKIQIVCGFLWPQKPPFRMYADALMLLMHWCCLFCWCTDALMLLMRWCTDAMMRRCWWCADAADRLILLMLLMRWCCLCWCCCCADAAYDADALMLLLRWCFWCCRYCWCAITVDAAYTADNADAVDALRVWWADAPDVLMLLMRWCCVWCWCADAVDALMLLILLMN